MESKTQPDQPDARSFADWFTPVRFGVLLAAGIAGVFPKVVAGINTLFYRDFGVLAYPMVFFHRESFWRGEIPLWNPLSNCGAPFLAQWGTMALYPGSLFYLVLPLPWSLNLFCLSHLFLGGLGMYFLAWRWVGNRFGASVAGMAFVFNGITLSCLLWPNYTVALGWMPWVVLVTEQAWREGGRKLILSAVLATLQLLAGVPEIVLLTWLVLLALWGRSLWKSPTSPLLHFGRILAVVLLVCGLAAAQLMPFFELLAHSQRSTGFATSKWAMPTWGWVQLLFPLFRCFLTPQGVFFQTGQEFLSSTYLGAGTVLFAVFAVCFASERRVWLFAGLGGFALLMALGDNGFLYAWVKQAIPMLGFARYPIKFVILLAFICPLLAAYTVRTLSSTEARLPWCIFLILGAGLLLTIVGVIGFIRRYPTEYDYWPAIVQCGILRAVVVAATIGLVRGLAIPSESGFQRGAGIGLLALLIFDAATHVPKQNPTLPSYALAPGLWELQHKSEPPKHGQGRVMISPGAESQLLLSRVPDLQSDLLGKRLAVWSNLNLLEGTPKVNGSSTLQIREQMEVQSLLYASTNANLPNLEDFLAVSRITTPGQIVDWSARGSFMPLVTGGQRPIFTNRSDTLKGLTNADFNPRALVYLPLEAQSGVTVSNRSNVQVELQRCGNQSIDVEVNASEPALLVIGQTHYSPWRAEVDGSAATIWHANHAFQALQVPAGRHHVRLIYHDSKFVYGSGISLATLAFCLAYCYRSRTRAQS